MNNNHDTGFLLPKKIINLTFILFMRVFILVLYLGLTSIYANVVKAQDEISVKVQGASLQTLFNTIQQKSDYMFFYNDDLLVSSKKINLDQYGTVPEILNIALSNTGLTYSIIDKQIVIKKGKKELQEQYELKGIVTDESGKPLIGVNVLLLGKKNWDITREKGDFRITVLATDSLRFQYVGYKSKTICVENRKSIKIVLKTDLVELKGVAIQGSNGYLNLPKERVTGSFEVMDAKELAEIPTVDLAQRIEGKMTGVKVDPRSGVITVRGTNSFSGSGRPLVVIDGFPQSIEDFTFSKRGVPGASILSNLDPDDVETITVLKDAAAASIWGSRAADGVIVITTKKGKKGADPTISFSATTTLGDKIDLGKLRVMNTAQYIDYEKDLVAGGFLADNITSSIGSSGAKNLSAAQEIIFQQKRGTISMTERDQLLNQLSQKDNLGQINKYLLKGSEIRQYNLSVSGGNDKSTYYLSLGHNKDEATMRGNESQSYNITLNNSFQLKSFLKLNTGINYLTSSFQTNNTVNEALSNVSTTALRPYDMLADENGDGINRYIVFRPEVAKGFEAKGYLPWTYNYLDELNYSNVLAKGTNIRMNASLTATVNSWLNFEASGMYTSIANKTRTLNELESYYTRNLINVATSVNNGKLAYGIPVGSYLYDTNFVNDSQSMRLQMNINKDFNENNSFHFLAGSEIREERREGSGQRRYGYNLDTNSGQVVNPTTSYTTIYGWSTIIGSYDNAINKYRERYLSYYGLGSYDFMNKYHLSGSVRFDDYNLLGASRGNRAMPFWSLGGKWDINKENFLKELSWLNNLSARVTYGAGGSTPPGGFGSTSAIINVGSIDFNTQLPISSISLPQNPEIKWETTHTLNFGLDYAVFNSRLRGSFDLYYKKTNDILTNLPLNPTYGWSFLNYNTGTLKGHGIDLGISGAILNGGLKWNSTLNFGYNTNEVTDSRFVATTTNQYLGSGPIEGKPIGFVYAYNWAGLDAKGQSTVYKKDGTVVNSSQSISMIDKEDLKYMGRTTAPYFGGFMNDFSYKNFRLGVQVTYYAGHVFRNTVLQNYPSYSGVQNGAVAKDELIADRWRQAGDEAFTNVPGLTNINFNSLSRYQNADINVLPADNIRLQQISLGYNVPAEWLRKTFMKSLSFNFAARNLGLLWVKNDLGIDPQYLSNNNYNTLPPQHNYTLQFNCSF